MGAFLVDGKGGSYWFLLSYLQGKKIYTNDAGVLPYTPDKAHTYVDYYPSLFQRYQGQKFTFTVNGKLVGECVLNDPSGIVYADIAVPRGKFTLVTVSPGGDTLKTETWRATNYAMFISVMAQSYEERRAEIELVKTDQDFLQIRSGRLYPVLGTMFGFPPPPGWPVEKYRAAILGGCGPGFIKAFFDGSTKAGVAGVIKSITCQDPVIAPANDGVRWVVRDEANVDPADPILEGFFVVDDGSVEVFNPPQYRAMLASESWWANAVEISVPGSQRAVVAEQLIKTTDSFLEVPIPVTSDVQGKDLRFSVEEEGNPSSRRYYYTFFPLPTINSAQAAANIIASNPTLTPAVYATAAGKLRLGVAPVAGKTFLLTILSGTSLNLLGLNPGDSTHISPDKLANPWLVTLVSISDGVSTFVDGVDFTSISETGELIWNPSTAANTGVPKAGAILTASYTYQMRREIQDMVSKVAHVSSVINFGWQP